MHNGIMHVVILAFQETVLEESVLLRKIRTLIILYHLKHSWNYKNVLQTYGEIRVFYSYLCIHLF